MTSYIINIFETLLNLIAPHRSDYEIVRKLSLEQIASLPKAHHPEGADWIFPLFQYTHNTVRAIIWELKYRGTTIPLEHIGALMHDEIVALMSDIILFEQDAKFVLIPIPISPERRQERGYNQSEYIAKSILEHDTQRILLYAPQWFEKIRETPKQSRTESRTERMENLVGCFQANEQVAGTYVILIDDVVTTGSTLSEARRALLDAGAAHVYAFTIAH